jgi:6-phosphofructokinase 2
LSPAQHPIVTLTLNPALDVATSTPMVQPGPKLRCAAPRIDPGGGGLNVSRAIRVLGGKSLAIAALGGATGTQMEALLKAEEIDLRLLPAPGETRQSLAVTDEATGEQYRFVMPGPTWSDKSVMQAMIAIEMAVPSDSILVISGSQPVGIHDAFITELAKLLAGKARIVADTSGGPLKRMSVDKAGVSVLRMDAEEAETLAGARLESREDSADFATTLVSMGAADLVIMARGAEGSVMASANDRWFCEAAKVPVKSKVGAGDSFVAGFVLAMARGIEPPVALASGMAAASAAVMTPATELCRRADAEALVKVCAVSSI